MDSMRSLNTSLPRASPVKSEPPEQILQAFKAAALSVTNLYKTAAADQVRARSEGYQDALDDLLTFLDKQNIGLSDGEGWRIRRWATERLDGREQHGESDEDIDNAEPPLAASRTESSTHIPNRCPSPVRIEPQVAEHVEPTQMQPPTSNFTFRSSHAYPLDADLNSSDAEGQESGHASLESSIASLSQGQSSHSTTNSARNRPSNRQISSNRHDNRSSRLGRSSGHKRKVNLGDFFDLGNLGIHRDGFGGAGGGGGKRARFT